MPGSMGRARVASWSLLLLLVWSAASLAAPKALRVGVVFDGPAKEPRVLLASVQAELRALTEGERSVRFPKAKQWQADWTAEGVRALVDRALADPEVDLLLTMGQFASLEVTGRGPLPKPVYAGLLMDVGIPLPKKGGRSGVKNLAYLAGRWQFERELELFEWVAPHTHMVVLVPKPFLPLVRRSSARALAFMAQIDGGLAGMIPVGQNVEAALAAIPATADAVYIAPLVHLSEAKWATLIAGLNARRLPTWSRLGLRDVRRGALAGSAPAADIKRRARRIALEVQSILLGTPPARVPVQFAESESLVVNMQTARTIERVPTWEVLGEAELLHARRPKDRTLNLAGAMAGALESSRAVAVARRTEAAGEAAVEAARGPLLPTVKVSATGSLIDEDRAAASLGQAPQWLLQGSATVEQIVYADAPWAGLEIEGHRQRERRKARRQTELDAIYDAGKAFLDLQRALNAERIQKDNVRRSRKNLDLAKVRVEIGTASPAEVHRWESEIARGKQDLTQIVAQRHQAEFRVNQRINRPMEEGFEAVETSLDDPDVMISEKSIRPMLSNPRRFALFRDLMVEVALESSPELDRVDALLDAQRRAVKMYGRRLYVPTVGLRAELSQRLIKGGSGSDGSGIQLSAQAAQALGGGDIVPSQDDTTWSVGLSASLPLYDGGRYAEIRESEATLVRLEAQRAEVAQGIELRTRASLQALAAAWWNIRLARRSADAAAKNFDLVSDAYARGAVSIIQLIDAQSAARVSDLAAANAVFDCLIAMLGAERAVGHFWSMQSLLQRKGFLLRARMYFQQAGVNVGGT